MAAILSGGGGQYSSHPVIAPVFQYYKNTGLVIII